MIDLYVADDPTWPKVRDEALSNPRLAELLVQNFIRALVRAHQREGAGSKMVGSWSAFSRHQAQLLAMADAATPLLIVGLRDKDKVVVALVKDTLIKIGASAVPALTARFDESPDVWERREILSTLAGIGGAGTIEIFSRYAQDSEWQIRGEALLALGRIAGTLGDDRASRARLRELLVKGFSDSDVFVRRQAVKGLSEMGDADSISILIERYRRTTALRLDPEERRELLDALRRSTRLPAAVTVEEFEAWIAERRRSSSRARSRAGASAIANARASASAHARARRRARRHPAVRTQPARSAHETW